MSNCKNCQSSEVTKNGFVRSKQRYRCKTCGYNFVEGDERTNPQTTIKRAFAVILYSLAKASYGTIANLFTCIAKYCSKMACKVKQHLLSPEIPINTRELEFDEMWHFIGSKKTKDGFTKQFLVKQAKPSAWVIGGA